MKRPQLSFAKLLWPLDPPTELVRVTVARHRAADAHAAADAIAADGSFLPALRAGHVQGAGLTVPRFNGSMTPLRATRGLTLLEVLRLDAEVAC
jgi:hypothetical protein